MAFNTNLADKLRHLLLGDPDLSITEKHMFGGCVFLLEGKMTVGVMGDNLIFRILKKHMSKALRADNIHPLEFGGREMKEFLRLEPRDIDDLPMDETLMIIEYGLQHASAKLGRSFEGFQ